MHFYRRAALIVLTLAAILFAGVLFTPLDINQSGDIAICPHLL